MDREERAAICGSTGNASPNNSALRLATAFSKGISYRSTVYTLKYISQFCALSLLVP